MRRDRIGRTRRFAPLAIGLAAATIALPAAAASDAEVRALREQLRVLEERLKQIETRQVETEQKAAETERVVKEETIKSGGSLGTFILPGTDTRVTIGGYVKGDFIYDASEGLGDLFVVPNITTRGPAKDENRFRAHARQTRFNIRTTTPSEWGPVKTYIEGDFFGGGGNEVFSNSTSFRLRHAWAEVGPLGAGQYWTNFMPIEVYPTTLDFQGPTGLPFIRQGQVRWTQPITDNFTVIGSLENSEFTGRRDTDPTAGLSLVSFGETSGAAGGGNSGVNIGIDVAPDAVLTGIYRDDWGLVRGSTVLRRFGSQGAGDGEWGYGFNLAGRLNITDSTRLVASATYGDGIGRYIIDGGGLDGVISDTGNISTAEMFGFAAQIQQDIAEDWTVALAYGRTDNFDTVLNTDFDNVQSIHGTVLWRAFDRVTLGAELMWGRREDADGVSDDAVRVQSSVQVSF